MYICLFWYFCCLMSTLPTSLLSNDTCTLQTLQTFLYIWYVRFIFFTLYFSALLPCNFIVLIFYTENCSNFIFHVDSDNKGLSNQIALLFTVSSLCNWFLCAASRALSAMGLFNHHVRARCCTVLHTWGFFLDGNWISIQGGCCALFLEISLMEHGC